ncbi:MAG: DMT family transporter [Rikenellaceae bacterium]
MRKIHFLAIVVVAIWGYTFVTTKLLINQGLTPSQIMFFRFAIAYLCMLPLARKPLFARNLRDELLTVGAGMAGGSLYFVAENSAIAISFTSNVAIIIASAPILTQVASHFMLSDERMTRRMVSNSMLALAGVVLVIFNGQMVLQLNPLGDLLALAASILWALYTVLIRKLDSRGYSTSFVTRKIFFYGTASMLPAFLFIPITPSPPSMLLEASVYVPLLFLAVAASFFCFFAWGYVVEKIGATKSAPYIYLVPVISLISAAIFLDEQTTPLALAGMGLILFGLLRGERHTPFSRMRKS